MSDDAVLRHKRSGHIPQPEGAAEQPVAKHDIETVIGFARAARAQDASEFRKAQQRGDWRTMAAMSREMRLANRDIAELEGDLVTANQVNIAVGVQSDNLQIAVAILAALRDEPTAKAKVLVALSRLPGMTIDADVGMAQIEAGDAAEGEPLG